MIQTSVVSGYPKTLADQKIRKTLRRFDEGKVSSDELERVYEEVTELAIRDQEEAGLSVVTDGCMRWDDEVTYFTRGLDGFHVGGLIRFFDTNVLYRQPRAVKKIEWKAPVLGRDFGYARKISTKPLKVVLTSPFTLVKLSANEFYPSEEAFLLDLCHAMNQEIVALQRAGATKIQVNEYSLARGQEGIALFEKAIAALMSGVSVETTLYFSFGDVRGLFKRLMDLPVTSIGIDFTYCPGCLDLVESAPFPKKLLAGIVDARNTRLESFEETRRTLDRLTSQVRPEDLTVSASASLEFLPLDRCRSKLRNMVAIVHAYEEGHS